MSPNSTVTLFGVNPARVISTLFVAADADDGQHGESDENQGRPASHGKRLRFAGGFSYPLSGGKRSILTLPEQCGHSSQAEPDASVRPLPKRLRQESWSVVAAGRAQGDLSTAGGARAVVGAAADELGGLDLLVNAAGEGFAAKPVDEVTEADWDAALGATAKGSFFVTQAAAHASPRGARAS